MLRTAFLTTVFAITATIASAGDPGGLWQSEKDEDGDWIDLAIEPCGSAFCGRVAKVHGGNPKFVGLTVIQGMTRVDENSWSDGKIFAVDEDTWYDSKMELIAPDKLKVSGCLAYGLLCKSQTLRRHP